MLEQKGNYVIAEVKNGNRKAQISTNCGVQVFYGKKIEGKILGNDEMEWFPETKILQEGTLRTAMRMAFQKVGLKQKWSS